MQFYDPYNLVINFLTELKNCVVLGGSLVLLFQKIRGKSLNMKISGSYYATTAEITYYTRQFSTHLNG